MGGLGRYGVGLASRQPLFGMWCARLDPETPAEAEVPVRDPAVEVPGIM